MTLDDVAVACGVSRNTVERARIQPENPNARPAPEGWQAALAQLARRRAADLVKLAERLEENPP